MQTCIVCEIWNWIVYRYLYKTNYAKGFGADYK